MLFPLRRPLLLLAAALLMARPALGGIDDLPRELLYGHALPNPDWSGILDGWIKEGRPIPDLPPEDTGPPETASPEELLLYWKNSWPWEKGQQPSPGMREKILEALKAEPSATVEALRALPQSAGAAKAIVELIPRMPATTAENLKNLRKVRAWVFLHGGLLREEVTADAKLADWKNYQWWTSSDETLDALKATDPVLAKKVLEDLTKADNQGLAVVAAGLLLESAEGADADKWRQQLIAAAADAHFPEEARETAVTALVKNSWPGKEAWFLGALKQEEIGSTSWFEPLVTDSPDRWLSPLLGLINGENRHAHDHAVCLLAALAPRPEAMRPLLPWLMDAGWAKGRYSTREHFIQALEEAKLPECVPALRHLILHDPEQDCVENACGVLLAYQAKEAVPDMKSAISRGDLEGSRHAMAEAVQGLGGFSAEEVALQIASFFTGTPEGADTFDLEYRALKGMTPDASVGSYFIKAMPKDEIPVELLVKQAGNLRKEHPEAAAAVLNFAATSPLPAGQKVFSELLASGELAEDTLVQALAQRREASASWDGKGFLDLTERKGATGGFAALLSGERGAIGKALASDDFHKQHAVIAAAWLSRDTLDIDQLARLYTQGQDDDEDDEKEPTEEQKTLADAAWTYLIDSEDPKAVSFVNKREAGRPAEEVDEKSGARASEIFSMAEMANGGTQGYRSLVIFPDHVLATESSRGGRSGSCTIAPEKVAALRNYVSTYHADELPTLEWGMADGISYYYHHATADGMKAVYMSNPPENRDGVLAMLEEDERRFSKGVVLYGQLMWQFNQVFEGLDMDYGYGPGIEIISPREAGEARSVWKGDGEIRVLVGRPGEWRVFSVPHERLLDAAKRPPGFLVPTSSNEEYPELNLADLRKPWLHRWGEAMIASGRHQDKKGLWRHLPGKEPELIAEGEFSWELVLPGGEWCVASKSAKGEGWAEPNTMVRIKLATKEAFPVDLPAAEDFEAIAFLDSQGKFLIRRSRDSFEGSPKVGPEKPEFHLLDPASGKLEKVEGDPDFGPLRDEELRPLQPTGEAFMVWAVDPSPTGNRTIVGKYDTKAFKFTPIREIQGIHFNSSAMWVDEVGGTIYAAVSGDLVKIPLKKAQ